MCIIPGCIIIHVSFLNMKPLWWWTLNTLTMVKIRLIFYFVLEIVTIVWKHPSTPQLSLLNKHFKEFRMEQKHSTLSTCSERVTAQEDSWAMSQTIHEKCLEKGGTPFFLFYLKWWGCKEDLTKKEVDKREKGWSPFCNQRWENCCHESVINLRCGPQETVPCILWPTSVLCVTDGRRSCPSESSWRPQWNPCSRLGDINPETYLNTDFDALPKIIKHIYTK